MPSPLHDLLHPTAPLRIVFKVFPQRSHLNATFGLARALREAGHTIIYAGLASQRAQVEAQGFAYHVEPNDFYPAPDTNAHRPRLTFWRIVRHAGRIRRAARVLHPRIARGNAFEPLLRALRPDFLLVDSPYTLFALGLYRHRVPFAILESMMNLKRAPDCPPLDTTYVPTGSRFSRFWCALHWRRYFAKRWLFGRIGLRADFNRRFVLTLARRCGVDPAVVDFDRYFHLGLKDVPELLLANPALDFPRPLAPNQVHAYFPPPLDRAEVGGDYRLEHALERFIAERENGRPLVYCSLGTGAWRYPGAEHFLLEVARSAHGQPWNLILSLGDGFRRTQFPASARNLHICRFAPQLRILRHADLMITHGGMNSINECAALGVPMIVCPGTREIDQAGNAARVVYWSKGQTCSIQRPTGFLGLLSQTNHKTTQNHEYDHTESIGTRTHYRRRLGC